jgi:hypothetical protein
MRASATLSIALFLVACGGGVSDDGDGPSAVGLRLTGISAPGGTPLALDGVLVFHFSEAVSEASIAADSIVIETADGRRARGMFVRGRQLVDPDTGTIVVIDRDQMRDEDIARAERRGDPGLVPPSVRYDLGAVSPMNGSRRVLFDRSRRDVVTFVPEIPVRPDRADTGFVPGTVHRIRVAVAPSPHALFSEYGRALRSGAGEPYRGELETKNLGDDGCFLGDGSPGAPAVVNTFPSDGADHITVDGLVYLRFSRPLDPATVTADSFRLEIASVPGRPALPIATMLRQTRNGLVEVVLTPLADLPTAQWFEVSAGSGIRDLAGRPLAPGSRFSFTTGASAGSTRPSSTRSTTSR